MFMLSRVLVYEPCGYKKIITVVEEASVFPSYILFFPGPKQSLGAISCRGHQICGSAM